MLSSVSDKEEEQKKQSIKEEDPFSINPPQVDTDISSIRSALLKS